MSIAEPVQTRTAEVSADDASSLLCFACSRCDYPICVSADLLLGRIPGGTTDYAFAYELDFLLDLDVPVLCYSGNEVVQTSIRVSEKVLDQQMPPAARVVALEAIVASRQFEQAQRHEMDALRHVPASSSPRTATGTATTSDAAAAAAPARAAGEHGAEAAVATAHEHDQRLAARVDTPAARVTEAGELVEAVDEETAPSASAQTTADADADTGANTSHDDDHGDGSSAPQPTPSTRRAPLYQRMNVPIRHLGATSESRVDLVCARTHLLAGGVRLSLEDRSGDNPEAFTEAAAAVASASAQDARQQDAERAQASRPLGPATATNTSTTATHVAARDSTMNATLDQVPTAVREAVLRPAPPTRWADAPGNLSVEEAYMTVTRTTHTAQAPWFRAYTCERRVECPDCHLPLGFLFVRHPTSDSEEKDSEEKGEDARQQDVPLTGARAAAPAEEEEASADIPTTEPAAKKAKLETNSEPHAAEVEEVDVLGDFIALELKRLKQREWGLKDFQDRYEKAQHLDTFRALFPEAEELQSLYSRLTALRTQAELYSNLLRKHREQNDVQTALLQSQKQRMLTYEEKLSTMQQIIDAQRRQLEMQGSQMQHQQELLRSHRQQLNSQQQQIEVEQLLITEQTKTIETQREQIKLMRAHLDTRRLQEQINEKKLELAAKMQRAYPHGTVLAAEAREAQAATSSSPPSAPLAQGSAEDSTAVAAAVAASAPTRAVVPPPHLRGIHDQGTAPTRVPATTAATTALLSRRWPPLEEAVAERAEAPVSETPTAASRNEEEERKEA